MIASGVLSGTPTKSGSGSVVEHLLAKEKVVGSNPIFRSILFLPKWRNGRRGGLKNRWGLIPVPVRIRPSAPHAQAVSATFVLLRQWTSGQHCPIIFGMTGAEFVRRVTRIGRERSVEVRLDSERGKGSHVTLHYGSHKTIVKDRRKELGPGLLSSMMRDLELERGDFR